MRRLRIRPFRRPTAEQYAKTKLRLQSKRETSLTEGFLAGCIATQELHASSEPFAIAST